MEKIEVVNNQIKITTPQVKYISIENLQRDRKELQDKIDTIDVLLNEAKSLGIKTKVELNSLKKGF